uniref:Secreted protein n=1 Tax=Trypanosoma congolense (strain IL3000) TaxID=1068625 RepID=G0US24_TRYCI|nr:hypothetical protein, unlikely [Trypanosoma congolense IL3000]
MYCYKPSFSFVFRSLFLSYPVSVSAACPLLQQVRQQHVVVKIPFDVNVNKSSSRQAWRRRFVLQLFQVVVVKTRGGHFKLCGEGPMQVDNATALDLLRFPSFFWFIVDATFPTSFSGVPLKHWRPECFSFP